MTRPSRKTVSNRKISGARTIAARVAAANEESWVAAVVRWLGTFMNWSDTVMHEERDVHDETNAEEILETSWREQHPKIEDKCNEMFDMKTCGGSPSSERAAAGCVDESSDREKDIPLEVLEQRAIHSIQEFTKAKTEDNMRSAKTASQAVFSSSTMSDPSEDIHIEGSGKCIGRIAEVVLGSDDDAANTKEWLRDFMDCRDSYIARISTTRAFVCVGIFDTRIDATRAVGEAVPHPRLPGFFVGRISWPLTTHGIPELRSGTIDMCNIEPALFGHDSFRDSVKRIFKAISSDFMNDALRVVFDTMDEAKVATAILHNLIVQNTVIKIRAV